MILDHYFPSVIGREEHPEWLPEIRALHASLFFDENSVNKDFYANGQTTYGKKPSLHTLPEFQPFCNFIVSRAKAYLDLQGYDSEHIPWNMFFFANKFLPGSAHPKHVHSQCNLSGIFYIDTPPGSSPIIFTPNASYKDMIDYPHMIKDPTNWYNYKSVSYNPYPGLMLIWPSYLYHEVPPNASVEPRTSIVFNL